jgi:hypothetical protein
MRRLFLLRRHTFTSTNFANFSMGRGRGWMVRPNCTVFDGQPQAISLSLSLQGQPRYLASLASHHSPGTIPGCRARCPAALQLTVFASALTVQAVLAVLGLTAGGGGTTGQNSAPSPEPGLIVMLNYHKTGHELLPMLIDLLEDHKIGNISPRVPLTRLRSRHLARKESMG